MILDKWQKDILKTKGNLCLRSGRQVGKSTIISIKAGDYALKNSNVSIMIIAKVERQALLLFEKVLSYIYIKHQHKICTGRDKPTKHKLKLKNGSVIHCLPAGESGYGIRGYTINLLIADEAAFIPEEVWTSVTPTIATTKGIIWLLSTPHGKSGYYYRCFGDKGYTSFHVSSEECPRIPKEFLEEQRAWMTKQQYAQEYLGEFVVDLRQFFSDKLIEQACILTRKEKSIIPREYALGVDIARYGEDESTFEVLDGTNRQAITQVDNIITRKTSLTSTENQIISLNNIYDFERNCVGIDDAGLGSGVFDRLMVNDELKRKVIGLNNARRVVDREQERKGKLMKEHMYNHLLALMEKKEILLLDDDEIKQSLESIQVDYDDSGRPKISGHYSHITEGLVRACWCIKNKGLNIFIA